MAAPAVHATCVALQTVIGPLGVLLIGGSGSGKSDLALRLVDEGAWLVADDLVMVRAEGDGLFARAVQTGEGLLEVRGFGITELPHLPEARLALAVRLTSSDRIERLPDPLTYAIADRTLPLVEVDPSGSSATAKIRLALRTRAAALRRPVEPRAGGGARRSVPVVVVSGLSGAGRTLSLKILEDLGYEVVDNLPLSLLDKLIDDRPPNQPLAVGADLRTRDFDPAYLVSQLQRLNARPGTDFRLLFLDCEDAVLQRRFTETRRTHPLAQDRPLSAGIAEERALLAPLRDRADRVIDTSQLPPAELRRLLVAAFSPDTSGSMRIFVTSFSYRVGLPRDADLVIDVRFLNNPFYEPALRPYSGLDPAVGEYVASDPAFSTFFADLTRLLTPLLTLYESKGRSYLTIAFGCTGGRHRSVAVAERIAAWLTSLGRSAQVLHRDLERDVETRRDRG